MGFDPWGTLRDARYALPGKVEKFVPGPGPEDAAAICDTLHRHGLNASVGYFQASSGTAEEIVAANVKVAEVLSGRQGDTYLSVKAPPLSFDPALLDAIAQAARAAGLDMVFDAHSPVDADRTLDAVDRLLPDFQRTGLAIPARWRRSLADALRFRESSARIRIVKGEWVDPEGDGGLDVATNYRTLVEALAGRSGTVAIATHDPVLADEALRMLVDAGTPCELEQLRGLPRRRTMAIARRLGVPVRVYVPFGPGWWPYAIDKALARPYLPVWMVQDMAG